MRGHLKYTVTISLQRTDARPEDGLEAAPDLSNLRSPTLTPDRELGGSPGTEVQSDDTQVIEVLSVGIAASCLLFTRELFSESDDVI